MASTPTTLLGPPQIVPTPEMQALMDKTAQKTVESQNAFEFEELIRRKQSSNPQFSFLFRGHPWNHYYEWKKVTLQQIQNNKNNNNNNDDNDNIDNNETMDNLINVEEFEKILSELNGSNHSINSASQWIMDNKQHAKIVCIKLKSYYDQNVLSFDKKLHILFMINDVLHQTVKTRLSIEQIDPLSNQLSQILLSILPNSYKSYTQTQQQKVMSLVNLWHERHIFSPQLTKQLKDTMEQTQITPFIHPPLIHPYQWPHVGPTIPPVPPPPVTPPPHHYHYPSHHHHHHHYQHYQHPHPHPPHHSSIVLPSPFTPRISQSIQPSLPKNTLHISIGKIAELALELRRTGGGGTYVPLSMDKIPPIIKTDINDDDNDNDNDDDNVDINDKDNKFETAMDEYWKELCLIDKTRKWPLKSSKRLSKSSRSGSKRNRNGFDSRSRSRSRSQSLSRSFSRSRSRSRSSSSCS